MRICLSNFEKSFFLDFGPFFDLLLAVLLVLGGRAYIGELGKKDLEKIGKSKTIHFFSTMQNFLAIHKNPFFLDFGRVLTHFWPFYWAWAVGPVKGSRTKKNLEKIWKLTEKSRKMKENRT